MQDCLVAVVKCCPYVEKPVGGILQFLCSNSRVVMVDGGIAYRHSFIQIRLWIKQYFVFQEKIIVAEHGGGIVMANVHLVFAISKIPKIKFIFFAFD